jgi:hypothetical protein
MKFKKSLKECNDNENLWRYWLVKDYINNPDSNVAITIKANELLESKDKNLALLNIKSYDDYVKAVAYHLLNIPEESIK